MIAWALMAAGAVLFIELTPKSRFYLPYMDVIGHCVRVIPVWQRIRPGAKKPIVPA
jgi:hypothetical protein